MLLKMELMNPGKKVPINIVFNNENYKASAKVEMCFN